MKKYIAFLRGINIRMLYFGLLIDSNIKNVIGGKKTATNEIADRLTIRTANTVKKVCK